MIALDTNIFIYWLEHNPNFYAKSSAIIKKVHSGLEPACCSVLVLSEVYSGLPKPIEAIKGLPGLLISEVTGEIAELAGKLRHTHAIKVIDAIHMATALTNKAECFITNDAQLASLKIPKLRIQPLTGLT